MKTERDFDVRRLMYTVRLIYFETTVTEVTEKF